MAKKSDEEKWWEDLGHLTQEEQQAALTEAGFFQPFGSFGEQEPAFDTGMESSMFSGMANIPEYTAKGALDPYDLTQAAKRVNYAQDLSGLSVDNVFSMMGGPGSYDTDAFTPTMEYGKEIIPKGRTRLDRLKGQGGWEGFIAERVDPNGDNMSPTQAMAALQDFIEKGVPDNPQDQAYWTGVSNSLRPNPVDKSAGRGGGEDRAFWDKFNYETVYDRATELTDALDEDELGFYDEKTGKYYDTAPEEIKTDQMKWYDKYGLPYPTASYEDPKYLDAMLDAEEGTNPEYRQAEAADWERGYGPKKQAYQTALRGVGEQAATEDQMLNAWKEYSTQPIAPMSLTNQMRKPDVPTGRNVPSIGTEVMPGYGSERFVGGEGMVPATGPAWNIGEMGASSRRDAYQAPLGIPAPMLRTLASGQTGLVGQTRTPRAGANEGLGVVAPNTFKDPAFQPFSFLRQAPGAKDRPLAEQDVSPKARQARTNEATKKKDAALRAQREYEIANPRLNDIRQRAYLDTLAKNGRNPLQDALAQRRAFARQMGL